MNGQLGQVHRSGYGYGPPSFDPDVYRSWVGQALASPVFVRVQAGQGAQVEGATTRSALNQALQMLGWKSPVNATNSTPGAPVVLSVNEQQAPQLAAMLGLAPGQLNGGNGDVGQVRCPQGQTYIPGVGCRVALRAAPVVQATVYAGTQVLRTGNTGQSRVNQAWKMIDDANKFFAVAAGQPAPAPKTHLCRLVPSSTGSVTYYCGVDVTGLPQSVVNQVINTLWPLAAGYTFPAPSFARGTPDGDLGQACPAGQTYIPGVGCRVALQAAPIVYARVFSGTQTLRNARTGLSRLNQAWKIIDDTIKFLYAAAGRIAPKPTTRWCNNLMTSTGTVMQCGVDVTGLPQSVVNQVINTLWPLAALTELATVAPLRGAPTVSGPDGDLGQICPTGTVIWPDGSKRYINASAAGKVPVCPPGSALSMAANQCRCSCPAGTFWNSRLESCAPSLRGAPDLSGAPSGQLGNPEASIGLSIGIGGLLLFGLAAYGIWRLARG